MKDLRPIRGKHYIADLISQGEHEHQDFKFAISDALKIARSISAFANNDGGRLLIGVKDNGRIAGVKNEEDIYVVEQAAEMYCRPPQKPRFTAFATDEGVVIRAEISKAQSRPVKARESDNRWRAYYRVADENIAASPLMVRAWQRQSDASGTLIQLTDAGRAILEHLASAGASNVIEIALHAGLSREAAEELIVKMAAMEIVCFRYKNGRFLIDIP